mmetsp:Transcript_2759/g.4008  ORF Transcript_2759/g.4008 Transcript_2759/m.4008 type:complete len:122 (-) Transcript_2759:324-689(-)
MIERNSRQNGAVQVRDKEEEATDGRAFEPPDMRELFRADVVGVEVACHGTRGAARQQYVSGCSQRVALSDGFHIVAEEIVEQGVDDGASAEVEEGAIHIDGLRTVPRVKEAIAIIDMNSVI